MFNDEKLNKIKKESDTVIADYTKKLDSVSADIKLLEELLKNSGISAFQRTMQARTFYFEDGRLLFSSGGESGKKPLIEHKALVRMDAARYLPDFFQACLDKIKELMEEKK